MATRRMRSRTTRPLKGLNIPKTGQAGNVGEVITKNLVVLGDPLYSTQPGHPRGFLSQGL